MRTGSKGLATPAGGSSEIVGSAAGLELRGSRVSGVTVGVGAVAPKFPDGPLDGSPLGAVNSGRRSRNPDKVGLSMSQAAIAEQRYRSNGAPAARPDRRRADARRGPVIAFGRDPAGRLTARTGQNAHQHSGWRLLRCRRLRRRLLSRSARRGEAGSVVAPAADNLTARSGTVGSTRMPSSVYGAPDYRERNPSMAEQPHMPDTTLGQVLGGYAAWSSRCSTIPRRWFSGNEGPAVDRRAFRTARRGVRDRTPAGNPLDHHR